MNRIIRTVALTAMLFSLAPAFADDVPASSGPAKTDDLGSLERQISGVYHKVAASIVLVIGRADGVIVSPDGYVLYYDSKAQPSERVNVRLSDGRILSGKTLGWSGEFGIGVVKIESEEPLPHVEFGTTRGLKAGDLCVAMGYPPRANGTFDRLPSLRFGHITRIDEGAWMTTSCAINHYGFGTSVFDMDGRLIGLTSKIWHPDPIVQTAVDVIKQQWVDLVAGKNLDWVRFPPAKPSVFHELGDEKDLDRIGPRAWKDPRTRKPVIAEDVVQSTIEKAKAATVRIAFLTQKAEGGSVITGSGVIVSADGFITCVGHFEQLPGEQVTISLSDGRDVPGVALGTDWVADVSLLKITAPGPWPHVRLGDSARLFPGDPIVVTGYPANRKGRDPLVAVVQMNEAQNDRLVWTHNFYQSRLVGSGGMCGGGVFDRDARLIGVTVGWNAKRIEMVRRKWDRLVTAERVDTLPDAKPTRVSRSTPTALSEPFSAVAKAASRFVVDVICDGRRHAVGTVVSSDGLIVTKASELNGSITCRFFDGQSRPATIQNVSRKHDLAVLKVSATELAYAEMNLGKHVAPGKPIAAILPDDASLVGVVSVARRSIPTEDIWKGDGLEDTSHGVEVGDLPRSPLYQLGANVRLPLKKGDLVTEIEGKRVSNLEAFTRVMMQELPSLDYHPGDLIHVTISRNGKSIGLRFPLPPQLPEASGEQHYSPRRSGFAAAFDTDLPAKREMCGAPVIDRNGRLVGIVIASRGKSLEHRGPTHVLPADVIRGVVVD